MVRIPDGSEGWIKRALDAGAAAVMVPRVEDAGTAARLAGFATYGPEGRRGWGVGVARAAGWGRDADGYAARWRQRNGLILQIESPAGLAAAAEIAAVPGVTQLFFGPSDFAACLGTARDDPRVLAAAREVAGSPAPPAARPAASPCPAPASPNLLPWATPTRSTPPTFRCSYKPLTAISPPPAGSSRMGKGDVPADPRGLIFEAYRMDIGPEDCRTIFLDWALGLPEPAGRPEIAALLDHYGSRHPAHPMTAVLREGLDRPARPPTRRRHRRP